MNRGRKSFFSLVMIVFFTVTLFPVHALASTVNNITKETQRVTLNDTEENDYLGILKQDKIEANINDVISLEYDLNNKFSKEAKITWETSDSSIATVDNAEVIALNKGLVYINIVVEDGGEVYKESCSIIINSGNELNRASATPALLLNEPNQFKRAGNTISNDYIAYIAGGSSYGFGTTGGNPDITTDNNARLTYGYSYGSSSGSGFSTIAIDTNYSKFGASNQVFDVSSGKYIGERSYDKVDVKEELAIVNNSGTNREDVVEIKYTITNNDYLDHNVGVRVYMDTQIGWNDSAPFRVPGYGDITTGKILKGDALPQFWQAMDNLSNPGIIAQGTLYKNPNEKPDQIQFGSYSNLLSNIWEASERLGQSNGDSGMAIRWNQRPLAPGEVRTYVTYYGISEFRQDNTNKLGVAVSGDTIATIKSDKSGYETSRVVGYVNNNTSSQIDNVNLKINLPSEIKLANGESLIKEIGTLGPGQSKSIYWDINADVLPDTKKVNFNIEATGDNVDTVSVNREFTIPELDIVAPTIPENVKIDKLFSHSAQISWDASSDYKGVRGYAIYFQGEEVGRTSDTFYRLPNLTTDKTYEYIIKAYDEAKNFSDEAKITVTPKSPVINEFKTGTDRTIIGGLEPQKLVAVVEDNKNLGSLNDESHAKGEFFYKASTSEWVSIGIGTLENNEFTVNWDITDIQSGSYQLKFVVTDYDNAQAERILACIVDRTAPQKIRKLTVVNDIERVNLSWTMSAEYDTDIYKIYRKSYEEDNFTLVKTINGRNQLSYIDSNLPAGAQYDYYVTAVDEFNQESEQSDIVTGISLVDTEAPIISKILPSNNSRLNGEKSVTIEAEDNLKIKKIKYYISTDEGTTWSKYKEVNDSKDLNFNLDTKVLPNGIVKVKAIAYDSYDNQSNGLPIYTYYVDNSGPEKVENLSYEAQATILTLKWSDVDDNDLDYFQVEEKDSNGDFTVIQKVYSTLGVNLINLAPNSTHTYRVVAYDKLGNRGEVSDELEATTIGDNTRPVITKISPDPSAFNKEINLSISAEDDYLVKAIDIQISKDKFNWTSIYNEELDEKNKKATINYLLNLDEYEEGDIYIRGIALDEFGNESDNSTNAPFFQYKIDKTAPDAPQGLKINSTTGCIEIAWYESLQEDVSEYSLYRSEDESGEYTLVASGVKFLNYFDRGLIANKTYYYKIKAKDIAGNESVLSGVVSGIMSNDTEKPQIVSVSPVTKSSIGANFDSVSALATDNSKLSKVIIEYRKEAFISLFSEDFKELKVIDNINDYSIVASSKLPLNELEDGEKIRIRVKAIDLSGNESDYSEVIYTVDKSAPYVSSIKATKYENKATINWTSSGESDLAGFKIYRKDNSNNYTLIGQQSVLSTTNYKFEDSNLPEVSNVLVYKIEAIDRIGNIASFESNSIDHAVQVGPKAILQCDKIMQIDTDYLFDSSKSTDDKAIVSYKIDFGDGTSENNAKAIHRYQAIGEYHVKLTVIDTDGNVDEFNQVITVKDATLIGNTKIKVVDDSGNKLDNIPVYFNMDSDNREIKYTDYNGEITFTADSGTYAVGAYSDGYLPAKSNVVISNNTTTNMKLILVKEAIVTGIFDVKRMTLEEIKAAGIDISAPENQHIFKVNVTLKYGEKEEKFDFKYNGEGIIGSPTITINTGNGDRILTPHIIGEGKDFEWSSGESKIELPIIAIVDIPVEASYLKEFFDVKLHILNNAAPEFKLKDNLITLNLPDDLTVVDSNKSTISKSVFIDEIAGQDQATINWILRGDKPGSYNISAYYSSTLDQFNVPVNAKFEANDPIKVYGTEGISMIIKADSTIKGGALYFDVGLKNDSDIDIYLPKINIEENLVNCIRTSSDRLSYDETKLGVSCLGRKVINNRGFRQYIAKDLEVLAPGETFTKDFVVYGVTSCPDIIYLKEMIAKQVEGLGIEIELMSFDKNLYSEDDSYNKFEAMVNGENIKYKTEIMSGLYYYEELAKKYECDELYQTASNIVTGVNVIFNGSDSETSAASRDEDIKSMLMELLDGEATQDSIALSIDTKYLGIVKESINDFKDMIEPSSDDEDDLSNKVDEALSKSENVLEIRSEFKANGQQAAINKMVEILKEELKGAAIDKIKGIAYSSEFLKKVGTNVSKVLGDIGTALNVVSSVGDAINNSAATLNLLVEARSVREEAVFMLDVLINDSNINSRIKDIVNQIKTDLINEYDGQVKYFVDELVKSGTEDSIAFIVEAAFNAFGAKGAVIHKLLSGIYSGIDSLFGFTMHVSNITSMDYAYDVTRAFRNYFNDNVVPSYNLADREGKYDISKIGLKTLKYVIKSRIIGEGSFVNYMNEDIDNRESHLDMLNKDYPVKEYTNFEDYYTDKMSTLLFARDNVFTTPETNLEIPVAPQLSINYERLQTEQSFTSDFEYSINNMEWIKCNGEPIKFTTDIFSKILRVRKATSLINVASNPAIAIIPAEPKMTLGIRATFKGKLYELVGLEPNVNYEVAFSNTDDTSKINWDNSISITGASGKTILDSSNSCNYLAIRIAGNNEAGEVPSSSKAVAVQRAVYYTVKFVNMDGTVISTQTVEEGEDATPPANPTYPNYSFVRWDTNYNNVLSDLTVKAVYEHNKVKYTLQVDNGIGSGIYDAMAIVTITANKTDKDFVGWKNENGEFVSYANPYTFSITSNMKLVASYKEEDEVINPSSVLDRNVSIDRTGTSPIIYFTAQAIVPKDYTLVEAGTVRFKGDTEPVNFSKETAGASVKVASGLNIAGQYMLGIKTSYNSTWFVKGYVTYRDKSGNIVTTYSNTVKYTVREKDYEKEDVNQDGKVDILDISEVSSKYNKKSQDSGFVAIFDLNGDNIIDLFDLVQLAKKIS